MTAFYEVFVDATEPWTDGIRMAVGKAIADYVETNLDDATIAAWAFPDWSSQLENYDPSYIGYGQSAHKDADMFVFSSLEAAERLANKIRYHRDGLPAHVGIWHLGDGPEKEISIKITNDDNSLIGPEGWGEYDEPASSKKFCQMVADAVSAKFPGYLVNVDLEQRMDNKIIADDSVDQEWVKDIISGVWQSWAWLVK